MKKKTIQKRREFRAAIKSHNARLAEKNDDGKLPLELVTVQFVGTVAAVLAHGREKYEAWNWTKGLPWMRTYGAVLRHLYRWAAGEELDPESGLPHLAHAACNIMFLMTWSRTHGELDDRKRL